MEIFILRHCKTQNNIGNSWSGCKTDIELSDEGKIRNKELINELSKIKFDVIFSSPLKRCLATSKTLADLTNTKLVIDERLIERNFGNLEGSKCVDSDKLKLSDFELNTDLNQGVEKIKSLYNNRVVPFFDSLSKKGYKRVLIVTHSWIVRLSKYFFNGENDPSIVSITPKNGFYEIFNLESFISRSFNSVEIRGGKVIKKSLYTSKFNDEINWMISIPNDLKAYIPKIYDYHISQKNDENDRSFITMEHINEKSFDQVYLNKELTNDEISSFFKQIENFLQITRNYSIDVNQDDINKYLLDIYYSKTIDRWNEIKDDEKFSKFYYQDFYINNKKFKSVKYYLDNLKEILLDNRIINNERKFNIVHGDLCFNNIIFKNNKMYLIDPRGSFGKKWIYGDQLYEIAKIAHSISGYDCIINNFYDLKVNGNKIDYLFTNTTNQKSFKNHFEKIFKDNLSAIYLIESLLFLSMIPLHSENYDHQILMLALGIEKISKFIK